MVYRTVHINGSGELRSMDLNGRQSDGRTCALCDKNTGTSKSHLTTIGHLVGPRSEIKVCRRCKDQV